MYKKKLGICIQDKEYENRFIRCLINHYKEQYEIHVLSSLFEAVEFQDHMFEAVITGDEELENSMSLAKKGQKTLVLLEKEAIEEKEEFLVYAQKYQEVYKIVEELKMLTEEVHEQRKVAEKEYRIIGISSLGCESLQLPFAAVCASVYGEQQTVLLMDLQPFSGLEGEEEAEELFRMEDVMSIASTGIVTPNRILGAICHEQKWDYIRPVRNTECLVEANEDIYQKMIEMIAQEQGYQVIIVNFGATFTGMFELMGRCQTFYCLREIGKHFEERERTFFSELKRRGKDALLQRMNYLELPVVSGKVLDWRSISKQWLWGTVGNQLREYIWVEKQSE